MKIATFEHAGLRRIGVIRGDSIVDLAAFDSSLPSTMEAFLALGDAGMAIARQAETTTDLAISLQNVRLRAPVCNPRKFMGIGGNLTSHLQEVNVPAPAHQIWFNKQVTCVNGPFDPVHLPRVSNQLDYEGEMAIVIGKRARHVSAEEASAVIAGYCICNDISVRDWQTRAFTATLGKSFDTHGPIGPWITTADEVPDPHALRIRTWVDGELRQSGSTGEFVFSIPEMIVELSTVFTLEPGDVFSTGSPAGVGAWMKPPQFLKVGQIVRVEVDHLGHLENRVVEEPPLPGLHGMGFQ